MKPIIFFRKLHKWLGLIIGLQILLWVAGGFVMSFFDIDEVRGTHNKAKATPVLIDEAATFSNQNLLQSLSFSPEKLELRHWQNRLVWLATASDNQQLIDAHTGEVLSPLSKSLAEQVASQDFVGDGTAVNTQLIREPLSEIRGSVLPIWQVQFNDADNTRIYVSQNNGEVVARRNDTWRLFDFFWMLHIMDYQDREDFNNPLLIFAALIALLMALSGLYLVFKLVFLKRTSGAKKS